MRRGNSAAVEELLVGWAALHSPSPAARFETPALHAAGVSAYGVIVGNAPGHPSAN